jgi:phage shock protein A
MALLERVATLIRANLNELIERAEEPETMLKQVMLDMRNQLMQVKTQVAIAIADQHLLAKKQKDNEEKAAGWVRKAELAVDRKDDELARAALDRSLGYRSLAENFRQQAIDQTVQVENLKSALRRLEEKLSEAQAKSELLAAQHRRARAVNKANSARLAAEEPAAAGAFERFEEAINYSDALGRAKGGLVDNDLESRLASLEKGDRIEQLLAEMKARRSG